VKGREREAKLLAWSGFELPDLSGVIAGGITRPIETRLMEAVYYDTRDLRLARWGVTVRHRTGDGDGWTVKLPDGDDGPALVRREITFAGKPGVVPPEVVDLVRAYVRSDSLAGVARLRTRRSGVELVDAEGRRVAEVVDDEVSVYERRHLASRFRELEVELDATADASILGPVVAALQHAGAGEPHKIPKVIRALGTRADEPPEVVVPEVDRKTPLGDVVRRALAASVVQVLRHDPGVQIGDDPEDVHKARVGTRRLRSDLHTFRALLDPEVVRPLRDELKWLATELGAVRDADVLTERLRSQAATLPHSDAPGAAALLRRLAHRRQAARAELLVAMSSRRYVELLDRLVTAAQEPPLLPGPHLPSTDVLAAMVSRRWSSLARAARRLADPPAEEELHALRIEAKRCRYATEAVSPVFGKRARDLAKATAGLQQILGDHQDAVVAEAWLREAAAASGVSKLVVGELIALQRVEAAAAAAGWEKVWRRVDDKQLRKWLD